MAGYYVTLQYLLFAYPRTLIDETAVLDHLLLSEGNGFEWRDGQLVRCLPGVRDMVTEEDARRLALERHVRNDRNRDLALAPETMPTPLLEGLASTSDEWARLLHHKRLRERVALGDLDGIVALENERGRAVRWNLDRLWAVSRYSPIMHVPDAAEDDWLCICETFARDILTGELADPSIRSALMVESERLSRMVRDRMDSLVRR